jgi:hypothetical protein
VSAPHPLELFGEPHELPVAWDTWESAARLGLGRVHANNATRTATQTRPMVRQVLQDVLGTFAELRIVRACANIGYDHDTTAWDEDGGVASQAAPDVTIRHEGGVYRFDVKCHMVLTDPQRQHLNVPPKRDFAINVRSLGKAERRGTEYLLPLMTAPGSRVVLLGRLLTLAEVQAWPTRDYGYGDPAYVRPMAQAGPELFGRHLAECELVVSSGATLAALATLVPESEYVTR